MGRGGGGHNEAHLITTGAGPMVQPGVWPPLPPLPPPEPPPPPPPRVGHCWTCEETQKGEQPTVCAAAGCTKAQHASCPGGLTVKLAHQRGQLWTCDDCRDTAFDKWSDAIAKPRAAALRAMSAWSAQDLAEVKRSARLAANAQGTIRFDFAGRMVYRTTGDNDKTIGAIIKKLIDRSPAFDYLEQTPSTGPESAMARMCAYQGMAFGVKIDGRSRFEPGTDITIAPPKHDNMPSENDDDSDDSSEGAEPSALHGTTAGAIRVTVLGQERRPVYLQPQIPQPTRQTNAGGQEIFTFTFQNNNKKLHWGLQAGGAKAGIAVDLLVSHMRCTSTMHGVAEHGCSAEQMNDLANRLKPHRLAVRGIPAAKEGEGGVLLIYRENTWGHRFVKMQVYDNCTDRLMCCTFTRCSSVTRGPGLMRVWVAYVPSITKATLSTVQAITEAVEAGVEDHRSVANKTQEDMLAVIMTDANGVEDPAKDRHIYITGAVEVCGGTYAGREGEVVEEHRTQEKVKVQLRAKGSQPAKTVWISKRVGPGAALKLIRPGQSNRRHTTHKGLPSDGLRGGVPNQNCFIRRILEINGMTHSLRARYQGKCATHVGTARQSEALLDHLLVLDHKCQRHRHSNGLPAVRWKDGRQGRANVHEGYVLPYMMRSDHAAIAWSVDAEVVVDTSTQNAGTGPQSEHYKSVTLNMNTVKQKPIPKDGWNEDVKLQWHETRDGLETATLEGHVAAVNRAGGSTPAAKVQALEVLNAAVEWHDKSLWTTLWDAYEATNPNSKATRWYPDDTEDEPQEGKETKKPERKTSPGDSMGAQRRGLMGELLHKRHLQFLLTGIPTVTSYAGGEEAGEDATLGWSLEQISAGDALGPMSGYTGRALQQRYVDVIRLVRHRQGRQDLLRHELCTLTADRSKRGRRKGNGKLPKAPTPKDIRNWTKSRSRKDWKRWIAAALENIEQSRQFTTQQRQEREARRRSDNDTKRLHAFSTGRTGDWLRQCGVDKSVKSAAMTVASAMIPTSMEDDENDEDGTHAGTAEQRPQRRRGLQTMEDCEMQTLDDHGADAWAEREMDQCDPDTGTGSREPTVSAAPKPASAAAEWEVGDVVAAQYRTEEQIWYDARVTAVDERTTEVVFDSGNERVSIPNESAAVRIRPRHQKQKDGWVVSTDYGHIMECGVTHYAKTFRDQSRDVECQHGETIKADEGYRRMLRAMVGIDSSTEAADDTKDTTPRAVKAMHLRQLEDIDDPFLREMRRMLEPPKPQPGQ